MRLLALVALGCALSGPAGASPAQHSVPRESARPASEEAIAGDRGGRPSAARQRLAQGTTEEPRRSVAEALRTDGAAASGAARKAVVELFTSQGCSSCPAADALLKRLAARDDLIALSLPVDYWDYLGWKDTLASPKFTERQRAYARTRGDGAIYTPQIVVNGLAHVNGSDEGQIARAIDRTTKALPLVPVELRRGDGKLVIEAGGLPGSAAGGYATFWLLVIAKSIAVPIERGENQGRTITYYNVVRELKPVGKWSGRPVTLALEPAASLRPESERCAVLLQQGDAGPIIGAALMQEF